MNKVRTTKIILIIIAAKAGITIIEAIATTETNTAETNHTTMETTTIGTIAATETETTAEINNNRIATTEITATPDTAAEAVTTPATRTKTKETIRMDQTGINTITQSKIG